MTNPSLPIARGARVTLLGVVGFAAALAAASHVAIPLPGTPVPMTLQPLAVVLAGLWLGPIAGAASMVLYLIAGAAGLPVFAPMGPPGVARLLSPTGGYLWAYPVAAWVAGTLGLRFSQFPGRFAAALAGIAMLHLGGAAQLTILTGSFTQAVLVGVLPFLPLDLVKALLAACLASKRSLRTHA